MQCIADKYFFAEKCRFLYWDGIYIYRQNITKFSMKNASKNANFEKKK